MNNIDILQITVKILSYIAGFTSTALILLVYNYFSFRVNMSEKYVLKDEFEKIITKLFNKLDEINNKFDDIHKMLNKKVDRE